HALPVAELERVDARRRSVVRQTRPERRRYLAARADGGSGAQGGPAGTLDGAEDGALVAEADLPFGGMHIDVEGLRRDLDADHPIAVAPTRDEPAVGLVDRSEHRPVVHAASVDDEDQTAARGAMRMR